MSRRVNWIASNSVRNGDVILLSTGNMIRIVELESEEMGDFSRVQWVTNDGDRLMNLKELHIFDKNLGQSMSVLASFYAARSVHERLNKLSKV